MTTRRGGDDHSVEIALDVVQTRRDMHGRKALRRFAQPIPPILDHSYIHSGHAGQHANMLRSPVPVADHAYPNHCIRHAPNRIHGVPAQRPRFGSVPSRKCDASAWSDAPRHGRLTEVAMTGCTLTAVDSGRRRQPIRTIRRVCA